MEEISPFLCKLCLFKIEDVNGSEIYLESTQELAVIISDIFHEKLKLTQLELDTVCMPCRDKLKSFYEYYKFVLENQNQLESGLIKRAAVYPGLVGSVTKAEDPEFVVIVKEEPKEYQEIEENVENTTATLNFSQKSKVKKGTDQNSSDEERWSAPASPLPETQIVEEHLDESFDGEMTQLKVETTISSGEDEKPISRQKSLRTITKKKKKKSTSIPPKKRNRSKIGPEAAHKLHEKAEEEEKLIKQYVKLICVHCTDKPDQEFVSFYELAQHIRIRHKNDLLIFCCSRKFRARHTLVAHLWRDHVAGPQFSCDICNEKFKSGPKLRSHFRQKHLRCEFCGIDMKSRKMRDNIWSHAQQHLLSPDQSKLVPCICDLCGKKLKDRTRVKMHLKYVHFRSVKNLCELCGIDFTTTSSYNQHNLLKHSDGPIKVPCTICGVAVKNIKWVIEAHMKLAHDTNPVQCKICSQTVRNKATLSYHMKRKHGVARHKCNFCEKAFIEKRRLKEHESVHLGISLYKCEFCGAEFKSHGNIAAHKRKLHPVEYAEYKAVQEAKKYELE